MMTAIRSSKLVGPVSIMLTLMMLALVAPTSLLPVAEAQGQNRLLLLFPVVDQSGSADPELAARMTDYLQMSLNQVAGLTVAEFSRTNPLVLRAVEEGQIRALDLETSVTDPISAIQMGYALKADEVCLATIAAVDTSEEPAKVELLLNGSCYDVISNVDAASMQVVETPAPASTFGVSGTSTVREGYTGSTEPLVREAMREAARAAGAVLGGVPAEDTQQDRPRRDDKSWRWVVAAAVVVGLLVAANADDDDNGGPSALAVPPTPLRLEIEASGIEMFWQAPNTTLTLLRYDLQRSTDNGATWNAVPGSQGTVLPNDTVFADFNVVAGQSYRYRIRAQYTTTGPSQWVEFGPVQFPG